MNGQRYSLDDRGQVCDEGEPMTPARLVFRLEGYERQMREYQDLLREAGEALGEQIERAKDGAA